MLTDISEALFVSFDLELSGVPSKQARPGKRPGKATLQERYLETKAAAERYQILQFGLTCVEQNMDKGIYILKPYNIVLSPLIDEERLDVERDFTFQSAASNFLLRQGFDVSEPFYSGAPYLSRDEEQEAWAKHERRQDRNNIADIVVKPTDTESLAFMERVRREIRAWLESKHSDTPDFVNIDVITDAAEPSEKRRELSRLEKRLVHQVVRADFKDLVSIGKNGFVQVIRFDRDREDRASKERRRETRDKINQQIGFRWIIEALLGSDISNFSYRLCDRHPHTGAVLNGRMENDRHQLLRAQGKILDNPSRLVGHNCFLDLVYIYKTFLGDRPETVEEFQRTIHGLWPTIIDTKYMSTHNCGDISPVSSLEQISEQLRGQKMPIIKLDEQHPKYKKREAYHEAGFDSYLTAEIAIRLSAKLERQTSVAEEQAKVMGSTISVHREDGPAATMSSLKDLALGDNTTDTCSDSESVEDTAGNSADHAREARPKL